MLKVSCSEYDASSFPSSDSLIIGTTRFANIAHKGQVRKVTEAPYITHPLRVAAQVMLRSDCTVEMVAAANLHDVVEDTIYTYEDILRLFGKKVADLVLELTNQFTSEKRPDLNRAARKDLEKQRLKTISREAKIIKMLDRIDNLKEIDYTDSFAKLYAKESRSLLAAVGDADPELASELVSEITIVERMTGMISSSVKNPAAPAQE